MYPVCTLPKATEAERLVVQRVGQGIFRNGLLDYWEGRCAVTGLAEASLLRASHIKPWAACDSDAERLDVFNGLLLAPHLDAAFDHGYIAFTDDRSMRVSLVLREQDAQALGLDRSWRLRSLGEEHLRYLRWHRERVFQTSKGAASDGFAKAEI